MFEPPGLSNTRFSVKGWFNQNSNSMFVHEIQKITNIPTDLPGTVWFSHPDFKQAVSGKGNGGYAAGAERPAEHNIDDEAGASTDNRTVIIQPPTIEMSFNQAIQTIKLAKKNCISSKGTKDDNAAETASRDVSTDETNITGELPNADWDNIDDQTDDSHLYLSKFSSFFKMLEVLIEIHKCEVFLYPLRKLPKLSRCKKHLLTTDANPRCLAVAKVIADGVTYHVLEVDTSDADKSLSTKLLKLKSIETFEQHLDQLEKLLLKKSLSWPTELLNQLCGTGNHWGVHHPNSKHKGTIDPADIYKWAERFYNWISR